MKNKKVYFSLFYISFLITFILGCFACKNINTFFNNNLTLIYETSLILIIISIILSILFIKKDIKESIVCPIFLVLIIVAYLLINYSCSGNSISDNSMVTDTVVDLIPYMALLLTIGCSILTILFIKKDIKASIMCPIIYLVFVTIVCILVNHYFSNSIYNSYMLYYFKVIFIGLLFVILYTCLCFKKKDKVKKEH